MQAQKLLGRDIVWESRYKLKHKHDDGLALADDVMIFAYPKLKKLFKVKHGKAKRRLKRLLKKAAMGAIEGYCVTVDERESVQHKGTQCNDGPSPMKRLKVQRTLTASASCMPTPVAAPSPIGKPVPRGMLGWQVHPPSPPPKPKSTANLKGMLSLGKQVTSPVDRRR
jgi:hypothetical protein